MTFQLVAGHLALDFANTLDNRFDPKRRLELLPNYPSFLEFLRQSRVLTTQQVRRLITKTNESVASAAHKRVLEIRENIDTLFRFVASGTRPSRPALLTFNNFLAITRVPDSIVLRDSRLVRAYTDLSANAESPIWSVLDSTANLLTSPDQNYIHECNESSCRWLFLDRSKNHSRRWCDMNLCGNRSKARRFRERAN